MNAKPAPTMDASENAIAIMDAIQVVIDGKSVAAVEGELLVEAILREKEIPHICYHSPLMDLFRPAIPAWSKLMASWSARAGPR